MSDSGTPDDRPEPGDDEAALLRFLAQFGIEPGRTAGWRSSSSWAACRA